MSASRMSGIQHLEIDYIVPDHYFVAEEVWIIVGSSADQCIGSHSTHPCLIDFSNKLMDTTNWQAGIGIQGSLMPFINENLAYGKAYQNEFSSVSVEIKSVSIGNG